MKDGKGGWEEIEQSVLPPWILRLDDEKANVTSGLSSLKHF